jgi:hypothetical protein
MNHEENVMDRIINNLRLPVQCICGHEFQESYGWLKSGPELVCPVCREFFSLSTERLRSIITSVEESLYRLSFIDISGHYFSSPTAFSKSRQVLQSRYHDSVPAGNAI